MQNPEAQRIPSLSDVDKARDEIKRKLVEIGGKWLILPMIYDQDVCHYFSLYCADKLMKSELLTEQEFSKESFLAAAKKYGSIYDSEIVDLHKKIKETEGIKAHYCEILRLINILPVRMSGSSAQQAGETSVSSKIKRRTLIFN